MKTLLSVLKQKDDYLIKLTSGLPGGIGGLGLECGGITAAVMVLGMLSGNEFKKGNIPEVIFSGHIGKKYL